MGEATESQHQQVSDTVVTFSLFWTTKASSAYFDLLSALKKNCCKQKVNKV